MGINGVRLLNGIFHERIELREIPPFPGTEQRVMLSDTMKWFNMTSGFLNSNEYSCFED